MKIMTGKNGTPHVTSQQFRQLVEGTVGQDSYILTSGECLEPELQTNNLLKIRSGMMSHHGNLSVVEIGTYDEVTIQNGTQGMQRIDLIVNRYTKNEETGIESSDWVVIQGTPSSESPAVPEYTEGNLQNGDLVDDCPVFEVHLNGINVTEVKKLLTVAQNISELIGNFQRGYFSFSTEGEVIGPMEIKKIRINFSRKMRIMPSVFVQLGNESDSDGYRNMNLRVQNMDTAGFTLVVSNNSNASYYPGIQWLAITI